MPSLVIDAEDNTIEMGLQGEREAEFTYRVTELEEEEYYVTCTLNAVSNQQTVDVTSKVSFNIYPGKIVLSDNSNNLNAEDQYEIQISITL